MKFRIALFFSAIWILLTTFAFYQVQTNQSQTDRSVAEFQIKSKIQNLMSLIEAEIAFKKKISNSFPADLRQVSWEKSDAVIGVARVEVSGASFVVQQFVTNPNVSLALTEASLPGAFGSPTELGDSVMRALKDDSGKKLFGLLFKDSSPAILLLLKEDFFQKLTEKDKLPGLVYEVISSSGLLLGTPKAEYIGTLAADRPIYLMSKKTSAIEGVLFSGRGESAELSAYKKSNKVNLSIIARQDAQTLFTSGDGLQWQILVLSLGLYLVMMSVIYFLKNSELPIQITTSNQDTDTPISLPKESIESIQKIRPLEAWKKVASAIGHELLSPLLVILGQAQAIQAKSEQSSPEIAEALQQILKSGREARGTIEKLFLFSGEEIKRNTTTKIEGPLWMALKNLDEKLRSNGVQVVSQFSSEFEIKMNPGSLARAFEEIIVNAIEAMDRMIEKKIEIKASQTADGPLISISDTGEGMSEAQIIKIFDPFFTTKNQNLHMGLGLSSAYGILKEHQAEVQIKSKVRGGTTVEILFRNETLSVDSDVSTKAARFEAPIAIELPPAFDLPPAPEPDFSSDSEDRVDEKVLQSTTQIPEEPPVLSEELSDIPVHLAMKDLLDFPDGSLVNIEEIDLRGIDIQRADIKEESLGVSGPSSQLIKKKSPLDLIRVAIRSPRKRT